MHTALRTLHTRIPHQWSLLNAQMQISLGLHNGSTSQWARNRHSIPADHCCRPQLIKQKPQVKRAPNAYSTSCVSRHPPPIALAWERILTRDRLRGKGYVRRISGGWPLSWSLCWYGKESRNDRGMIGQHMVEYKWIRDFVVLRQPLMFWIPAKSNAALVQSHFHRVSWVISPLSHHGFSEHSPGLLILSAMNAVILRIIRNPV